MKKLVIKVKTVFGLGFDIEKSAETKSGFRPAQEDFGTQKALFGDLRLEGYAALLRLGFAEELVVIGSPEHRYEHEDNVPNRAVVIRHMLINDYGIQPSRIRTLPSESSTWDNLTVLEKIYRASDMKQEQCAVVTNHYHIPRVQIDLLNLGMPLLTIPAEVFILLEKPERREKLYNELGGCSLADRVIQELSGIADKIAGQYASRNNPQSAVATEV